MPDMDLYEDEFDDYDVGELELIGEEDYEDDDADELEDLLELIEGLDDEEDDEDDEVGARAGRRRARRTGGGGGRRANRRKQVRAQVMRKAEQVVVRRPSRAAAAHAHPRTVRRTESRVRTLMLGGQEVQGPVAGQLLIPTTVQELARVDRLFVTGFDANGAVLDPASYMIADIKVGTKSQLAALPPLPGVMFQADSTGQGSSLRLDTVQTGTDFTVIIANAPAGSTFTWGAYARADR